MNLLVTGAGQPFAQELIAHLQKRHRVRGLDRCSDPAVCEGAVAGMNAVVHAANFDRRTDPSSDAGESQALEDAGLGSYYLADAARKAGIERIVIIGSLRIFSAYPENLLIDEMWRPRPQPEPGQLGPFLAEQCVREFVREGPINGVCLRFLPIGGDPETETRLADALHAVDRALVLPLRPGSYRWEVFHIANSPRFLARDAMRRLRFQPIDPERRAN